MTKSLDLEKIKNLYLIQGKTVEEISKQMRVGKSIIYRKLHILGCCRSTSEANKLIGRKNYKKLDELKILELYENGLSTNDIGKRMGVGSKTIGRRLGKHIRTRHTALILYGKTHMGGDSPRWKGGKIKMGSGHIRIFQPEHPRANHQGYVLEHILVYEKEFGEIPKGYVIHHINGIPDDNRLENLISLESKEHVKLLQIYQKRIRELEEKLRMYEESLC